MTSILIHHRIIVFMYTYRFICPLGISPGMTVIKSLFDIYWFL